MKTLRQLIGSMSLLVLLLDPVPSGANDDTTGILKGKVEIGSGRKDQSTVVYLQGVQGDYKPPQQAAVLDQKDRMFMPHLLPVQRGQTVRFTNSDPFSHNVYLFWGGRSRFVQAQPPGRHADWTATGPGEYVVLCTLHPEMSAVILVLDHPFYSEAGDSEFTIENIPAGTYTLVAVRDVRGNLERKETQVTIKGGETTNVVIQY